MTFMSESSLQPGARVGNYLLQELIGEGGFAQVWKATHHERPGRVVAVKIAVDEAFRRQLSLEGRLPDIDHPNVVPILDSDTRFAATPYIVMPYLPGGSLGDLIAKHPHGLPEERVESLLENILAGLSAAHAQGIVHRDIKPANVMLDGDGQALISDFGLSLAASQSDGVRSIVQSGLLSTSHTLAGTLAYMAPEVREGEPATKAADVYAVGVMLFEMLVGRRPVGPQIPSMKRRGLRRAELWNVLYRQACDSLEERFADARAMDAAMHGARQVLQPPIERSAPATRLTPPSIVKPSPPLPPTMTLDLSLHWPPAPRPDCSPPLSQKMTLDLGYGASMEFVLIPAGTFQMGSELSPKEVAKRFGGKAKLFQDEHPRHAVTITRPFYLATTEVTVGQFRQFVNASGYVTEAEKGGQTFAKGKKGGYAFKKDGGWRWREDATWRNPGFAQTDAHPVVLVSWNDAKEFCQWLSMKDGREYRLPTEAEWEYACRGGTQSVFWWGDEMDTSGKVANTADQAHWNPAAGYKSMPCDDGYKFTAPVASYRANGYGLYDMIGNVWEWCADWYEAYPGSSSTSEWFGQKCRVLRGGSWLNHPYYCRSAKRGRYRPGARLNGYIGLRVAVGT